MDRTSIDCKLDAIQELSEDLRKERVRLQAEAMELTHRKQDFEHLLNPEISHLPADKLAMIVADYRKVLSKRSQTKVAIDKIDKVLAIKMIDISNMTSKPSNIHKVYNIRIEKNQFEAYGEYIHGDVSYRNKKLKLK